MNETVKTIDELMEYLNLKGIETKEDDRQDLINYGYFHGYKGYRYFKDINRPLLFKNFNEVVALIKFDAKLKSLLYEKLIFIETAIKNITLSTILETNKTANIETFYEKAIISYNNCPKFYNEEQKFKAEENAFRLKKIINDIIYNGLTNRDEKILHFIQTGDSKIPLYSIFETLTMGDFAFLFKCLTYEYRKTISNKLKINNFYDFDKTILSNFLYLIKDLRNAIAHNNVIFDCRFKKSSHVKSVLKKHLNYEMNTFSINFGSITDYIILVAYFLKLLNIEKSTIINFISNFELEINNFQSNISKEIFILIYDETQKRKLAVVKKKFLISL